MNVVWSRLARLLLPLWLLATACATTEVEDLKLNGLCGAHLTTLRYDQDAAPHGVSSRRRE